MYGQIYNLTSMFFKSLKGKLMYEFLILKFNGKRGLKRQLSLEQIKLGNKIFYDTYLKCYNKNNERLLSHNGLSMRMQEKWFKRRASNSKRFWMGLVLRNEWRG